MLNFSLISRYIGVQLSKFLPSGKSVMRMHVIHNSFKDRGLSRNHRVLSRKFQEILKTKWRLSTLNARRPTVSKMRKFTMIKRLCSLSK